MKQFYSFFYLYVLVLTNQRASNVRDNVTGNVTVHIVPNNINKKDAPYNISQTHCRQNEVLTRRTLCSLNNAKRIFWFCNQNPSCNFFCSKDESYLYEKAAAAWKSTKQPHPRCEKHGKLVKMRVVKNLLKSSYGRPFFVCSDQSNPCSFWVLGDVRLLAKPKCCHGFPCAIRKVKKETINKDRLFSCCAQEDSCNYFEWVPEEPYCSAGLPQPRIKQDDKRKEQYPTEDFINDLANLKSCF